MKMRAIVCFVTLFAGTGLLSSSQSDEKPLKWPRARRFTQDVWWPGKAPGETGKIGEEKILPDKPGQRTVKRLTNVTRPTLAVFRPEKEKDTGAAVVIAPGGGYSILAGTWKAKRSPPGSTPSVSRASC
jgi:hypothetical protein